MKKEQTVKEFLIKRIKYYNGDEEVDPEKSFEDNGVDSLDKVEISMDAEKEFKIEFPDYILYNGMKTVSDWAEFIEAEIEK